jgi:hypothetical protein
LRREAWNYQLAWNTLIDQPWKIMSIARRDWAVVDQSIWGMVLVQRDVMEYRPDTGSASLRLDVEGLDDVAPRLRFLGDELTKIGRRARKHRAAQVGKPRFRLGVGEYLIDLPVELVDDLGGRALWRARVDSSALRSSLF